MEVFGDSFTKIMTMTLPRIGEYWGLDVNNLLKKICGTRSFFYPKVIKGIFSPNIG